MLVLNSSLDTCRTHLLLEEELVLGHLRKQTHHEDVCLKPLVKPCSCSMGKNGEVPWNDVINAYSANSYKSLNITNIGSAMVPA